MSEGILTADEAGVLLAVLQSCDWDEPLLPGLIERFGSAHEIVLRIREHTDDEAVSIPAVAMDPDRRPIGTMIDVMRHRRSREHWITLGIEAGGELEISLETARRIASVLEELAC